MYNGSKFLIFSSALALVGVGCAAAQERTTEPITNEWAKRLWEYGDGNGYPAITRGTGEVFVVLSQKAIDRSGLPADEAVKVFLEAWGPTMCPTRYSSDALVDLTKKNEHLRVTLQIELPVASGNVVSLRSKIVERRTKIVVGENEIVFEIDYEPRYIRCASPSNVEL